jgi:hypothetical protein
MNTLLSSWAITIKGIIKEQLQDTYSISLAIDVWLSLNKLRCFAINAYYITTNLEYHKTLLQFITLEGPYLGSSLTNHVIKTLKEYDL